jgi:N-acetylneuraminic acid mutarotase
LVPGAPAGGQDAVTAGTTIRRVYVIESGGPGFNGVIVPAHIYRYNQQTNIWSTLPATLPAPRWEPALAAIGGDIYVFGGAMGTNGIGTPRATVWRYRISTGQWKTLHPMPVAERGAIAVVGNDGMIYLVGGGDDPRIQVGDARVQIYNPATDTWTMGPSLTTPRAAPAAGRIGSAIYVAGGGDYPGMSETLSSVDFATISP